MYEIDSANFTSKSNPKQEFIRYFKDSGAAAAVQKAMTLLYRMPVKPTNLAEYFSQYFENGGQQLMRISLLKAELCYKRGELQNRLDKIKESEKNIEKLCNLLGISQSEFNERFVPKHIKERYRLSILERYFKDLEKGLEKTLEEVSEEVTKKITVEVNDMDEYGSNYDVENDCLRDVQSDHAIRQDMIELDPWGIICKAPKDGKSDDHDQHKQKHTQKHHNDWLGHSHRQSNNLVKSEISLLMDGHAEAYPDDEHEHDDDDAATLAELFCSTDVNLHEEEDDGAKLHNQLLAVKKADNVKMGDFMGWSPLHSRENLFGSNGEAGTDRDNMDNKNVLKSSKKPLTEYDLFDASNLDDSDFEDLKQRPCYQTMMGLLQPQHHPKSNSLNAHSGDQDTDAFLFEDDDDMDRLYKMMESAQQTFDYELTQHSRPTASRPKEEICVPICSAPEVDQVCQLAQPGLIECPCGEMQCQCPPPENANIDFPPGKMVNWTHDFEEYPCSLAGEYGAYMEGILKRPSGRCSAQEPEKLPDVPLIRVDSSCHCMLTGTYSTSEITDDVEEEEEEETMADGKKKLSREEPFSPEEIKNAKKRASGDAPEKQDEQTNTEVPLEQELDEVFKTRRPTKAPSTAPRKTLNQQESVDDMEESTFFAADVFGIDLAKEVKRDIIGLTDSELNTVGAAKQSFHGKIERKSHAHHVIQKHKSTTDL